MKKQTSKPASDKHLYEPKESALGLLMKKLMAYHGLDPPKAEEEPDSDEHLYETKESALGLLWSAPVVFLAMLLLVSVVTGDIVAPESAPALSL